MKLSLFQRLIPKRVRLRRLQRDVLNHYDRLPADSLSKEERDAVEHIRKHGIQLFPDSFPDTYRLEDSPLEWDPHRNLHYTLWDGQRLYHKPTRRPGKAQRYFHGLRIEQDVRSPHRYLSDTFDVEVGDVVMDIGAAEGNFGLSGVGKAGRIFLMEPETAWHNAIQATFEPWKEKVTLLAHTIGDRDHGTTRTLDSLFPTNQSVHFIKIDVEGQEARVLRGAKRLIEQQQRLRIAVCTYHRQTDADELQTLLESLGFHCEFTPGYMLYHFGSGNVVEPPYLRRGVLRATRIRNPQHLPT